MDSPDLRAGVLGHALSLGAELLRYVKARTILAGLEAKAAGAQYGLAAALVAGALFVAVLGYLFLVLTAVFAIGLAFDTDRAWVAVLGGAALFHLSGAAALIFVAKKRLRNAPFSETLAEFENDHLWLRQLTTQR